MQDQGAVLPEAVHVQAVPRPGVGPHGRPRGGEGDALHALWDTAANAQVDGGGGRGGVGGVVGWVGGWGAGGWTWVGGLVCGWVEAWGVRGVG